MGTTGLDFLMVNIYNINMKKYFTKLLVLFSFTLILPLVSFAQNTPPADLAGFFGIITSLLGNAIIPLIFTIAFMFFVWGVVQYVLYPDDEGKKEKGRQFMIWGLIALTVMFSVWGLVSILTGTFGIDTSIVPHLPETPN